MFFNKQFRQILKQSNSSNNQSEENSSVQTIYKHKEQVDHQAYDIPTNVQVWL